MAISAHTVQNARLAAVVNYPEGIGRIPDSHWQYVKIHTGKEAEKRINVLRGIGALAVHTTGDLRPVTLDSNANKALGYTRYGIQVRMSSMDLEEVPELNAAIPRAIGKATAATKRAIVHEAMASSFTGTNIIGMPLVSSTHYVEGGDVRSNKVDSAWDRAAFMAAKVLIRRWVDSKGLPDDWSESGLIVALGAEDEEAAIEIFGSMVSSSENQVNAAFGAARYSIEDIFTNDGDFLVCSADEAPFDYYDRVPASLYVGPDSNDHTLLKWNQIIAGGASAGPTPDGIVGGTAF